MWYMHEGIFPWMWVGGIGMFILWGVIIALIIWAVIRLSRHEGSVSRSNALEIAKERYARGEISKSDFDQIKKDLN